ncbi:MAG: hypothetical protein D6B26_01505, partial [Spirochaetaceae bacterium]
NLAVRLEQELADVQLLASARLGSRPQSGWTALRFSLPIGPRSNQLSLRSGVRVAANETVVFQGGLGLRKKINKVLLFGRLDGTINLPALRQRYRPQFGIQSGDWRVSAMAASDSFMPGMDIALRLDWRKKPRNLFVEVGGNTLARGFWLSLGLSVAAQASVWQPFADKENLRLDNDAELFLDD